LLLVREPTVSGDEAPDTVCVAPPSLDVHVAVKPVIAMPPFPFAVNATSAELSPRVTLPMLGAAGVVAATNALEAAEAALFAIELLAMILHVYVRAFESDPTVTGELGPVFERVIPPLVDVQVTR
jgi:hypothetical protein